MHRQAGVKFNYGKTRRHRPNTLVRASEFCFNKDLAKQWRFHPWNVLQALWWVSMLGSYSGVYRCGASEEKPQEPEANLDMSGCKAEALSQDGPAPPWSEKQP